ncbi:MAG: class I SAM-dependent RNA methyltransferase, partial [Candidatus Scalindua sp.]
MKKGKTTFILKADLPAYGGLSIGRCEGKVVMIKGAALPEEIVEVNIEEEKKDYYIASVTRIIEPSPYRIEPACNFFGSCGGCHLQYISYKRQVQLKEEILRDCLKRLAKIEIDLAESIIHDNPWNYRFRGQFKISHEKIGFYREKTREVIDIDHCPLMVKEINEYLKKAKILLKGLNLREIHITNGDSATVLVKVPTHAKSTADRDELASMFLNSGFSGLFIEAEDKEVLRYGKPYTTLKLENLKYTISPMSFFQSHWRLNQAIVKFIKDNLLPLKGKKVLDLYSGAGNFSLPLAMDAEVIAVEENPYAIEDGKRNLEINNIKNCRFICSSAENFHVHIRDNFHILILDPPRLGLTNRVINKILTIMPERIVYISCNPTTFSRDLKKLLAKYDIESIRMIDFFPQTFHIESLTFL